MHGQRNIKKEKKISCFLRRFLCLNFVVLKKKWYRFHARNINGRNTYHLRKRNITQRTKITTRISRLRGTFMFNEAEIITF